LPDGSKWISDNLIAPPYEVAQKVAERMLAAGAAELLS
jgi:hypothetical protein